MPLAQEGSYVITGRICAVSGNSGTPAGHLVSAVWNQSQDGLQMAGAVPRRGAGRLGGPIPAAPATAAHGAAAVREALLADRRAHPCWGARKLRQRVVTQG